MAVDGSKTNLMIVCGEPSGDELGARLVDEIRKIESEAMFFGATGAKMRAAGVETIVQSDDWPITGVAAVMRSIPAFYYRLRFLEAVADKRKPSAVILIDFPEFNLKLAKRLKKQGHTIIYYVSPQLWAWRKYRVRSIAKYVDLLLSILPFEKEWYSKQGVENVVYVGNPIAENVRPAMSRAEFCIKHGLDNRKPIIALLPGSRGKEIRYHLPLMLKAGRLMLEKDVSIQFVLAAAQNDHGLVESIIKSSRLPESLTLRVVRSETFDALNAADAAAISSGTATLEAGIIGTPMAIVYKMSKLDAMLLRPMIKVDHIGLINLVAGKRIMNEFVQNDFTAETLTAELFRLIDSDTNKKARNELRLATEKLKTGASKNAAESIIEKLTIARH